MHGTLARLSWLITARPWLTVLAILIVTVALGAGMTLRATPPTPTEKLPSGSDVAQTLREIDALFGDAGETSVGTLLFRGEALTPDGLAQMDALLDRLAADPAVAELLAPAQPITAPAPLIKAALQLESLEGVTQAQIDAALRDPRIGSAVAALTGTDADGAPVAIALVRLIDTDDDRVLDAERRIDELAAADEGPLRVSSVSPTVIQDAYTRATEEGLAPLVGLALLLIAGLLLLFLRALSDMLLTLAGLFVALIWIVGAEGWLGPDALGLIGPPNPLTALVPIIVISLTVDYAIQAVSHYREQRLAGEPVVEAVRIGLRTVVIPLLLAAVTTIVSFLVNLFSPIEIVSDFGVIAGLGVGLSLIVMLTLLPAVRVILDRRREARGSLKPPRPLAGALPGIGRAAELLGRSVSRRPTPYLIAVLAVTAALGYSATTLQSAFSIRDLLPSGGSLLNDMETLDDAVGGSTEMASILVKAEATEARTLLNLRDLTDAFADETRRPRAAAGPIQASLDLLVRDWTTASGEPGDAYDPQLAALFREASSGIELDPDLMQEFLDRLEARDPAARRLLANNPAGEDAILIQVPLYGNDTAALERFQDDIEALWDGDDDAITATSLNIIDLTVTESIIDRQAEAVATTILVAIAVLALFFWATVRQPLLALIAVGPIVLVLIMTLGLMALLNIPYSLISSIIIALSIGIGVDYTIHVIHRYREEFSRSRNPEQAAVQTLATTGSALLGSALTTALGFGVLIISPLAASREFGLTAAIAIVCSLIVSILVVPPAMTVWGAYQNMRLRSTVRRWVEELDELDEVIENVHRRHEQERDPA